MATTALRIGDTVRIKSSGLVGRVDGIRDMINVEIEHEIVPCPRAGLERVDVASLAEEIESGSAERSIRIPTACRVEDGKIVIEPTLSYLRSQPLATARMTPHEALLLAQSLIDSAAKALGR